MSDARRFAPATARNREPIGEVLARVAPPRARVLEIASGTGEHAVFLAERLSVASWQPTDPDAPSRASIDAWRAAASEAVRDRLRPAEALDVHASPWPPFAHDVDLVVCINMVHISPWTATAALMRGAAETLARGGVLYLYGPYRRGGAHTSESNAAFDASLRARDASWGVRDLEAVVSEAERRGFALHPDEGVVAMPANNLSVVLVRA